MISRRGLFGLLSGAASVAVTKLIATKDMPQETVPIFNINSSNEVVGLSHVSACDARLGTVTAGIWRRKDGRLEFDFQTKTMVIRS